MNGKMLPKLIPHNGWFIANEKELGVQEERGVSLCYLLFSSHLSLAAQRTFLAPWLRGETS